MSKKPPKNNLSIVDAHANNLKNISLELEHDTLTVITGRSGSGKSTLAFDTVHAEGHRRYIETFSPYTRQFFDKTPRPEVERIENVRPSVAIEQRTRIHNSRSTVGSITNINDYLKILWANLAKPFCPICQIEITRAGPAAILNFVRARLEIDPGLILGLIAPVVVQLTKKDKSQQKKIKAELARLSVVGVTRLYDPSSNKILDTDGSSVPCLNQHSELLPLIERFKSGRGMDAGLVQSVEHALSIGNGRCYLVDLREVKDTRGFLTVINNPTNQNLKSESYRYWEFRSSIGCPQGDVRLPNSKPGIFSYNHPLGACSKCKGFGNILSIDPKRCVPDERRTIEDGAIHCWSGEKAVWERSQLKKFCRSQNIPIDLPWSQLGAEQKQALFNTDTREYCGVLPWFKWLEGKVYKMHVRVFLSRYRVQERCPDCKGARLNSGALAYRINGRNISDLWQLQVADLLTWITGLRAEQRNVPRQLVEVFNSVELRLRNLCDLGVEYLTLDRQARTLSGGETQRVNLASAMGSGLVSTQFVLDEPTVGLHPRDSDRLLSAIERLKEAGNSVLVVEHDPDCILRADNIIELGPHSGSKGGEVIYQGSTKKWNGLQISPEVLNFAKGKKQGVLSIRNATLRNLKRLDLDIPLGKLVTISGVSGSGKSTLIDLIESRFQAFKLEEPNQSGVGSVKGFEQISQLEVIDQTPLAKNPRANVATYTGIWDRVRDLLAGTESAHLRKLTRSSFSFNLDGGRCPSCNGAGHIREDMQFLSDVYIACDVCLGRRFQPKVLEVKLKDKDVSEILKLSIEDTLKFFEGDQIISASADVLCKIGLGYLTLGHSLSELSGGEAQRLKLVPYVKGATESGALLIFDEPTTGLHLNDVENLLQVIRGLCTSGNSVICVEHNLMLVAQADWIVDLGPEGGDRGGELLFQGTPRELYELAEKNEGRVGKGVSHTSLHLRSFVDRVKRSDGQLKPFNGPETGKAKAKKSTCLDQIVVTGAREHNLKNISFAIPHRKLIAITGVSGSGKSSIAKDILYAEGQRRYLDCLSPYARQFIEELAKPEIDKIENIMPTVCVYQHTFQPGRLSTVGTVSEIYNFLRLLYAKIGTQYCPDHPKSRISALSSAEIVEQIKRLNGKVKILAPIIKQKKGTHKNVLQRAIDLGIDEVRVDGRFTKPSSFEDSLAKSRVHSIDYVIARFYPNRVRDDLVKEAVEQSLALSAGTVLLETESGEMVFSSERTCPECKRGFFKLDPEDFSFHSRRGRCSACEGSGSSLTAGICSECGGARINSLGRNVRLGKLSIAELCALTPGEVRDVISKLRLDTRSEKLSATVLPEMFSKVEVLENLGIGYLSLNRDCLTLSAGELQRLRLASVMAAPLSGALYIFDEPTIGLHPADTDLVLDQLNNIKQLGNTVLMIEHDPRSISSCEYVIDVGPGGGREGGEIVFSGDAEKFTPDLERDYEKTCCSDALYVREQATYGKSKIKMQGQIKIRNGAFNNINNLNINLPLNSLIVVGGVSGAGKSSFVHGIVENLLTHGSGNGQRKILGKMQLDSTVEIERCVVVDQAPIGRTSRSTPASYLKIWDEIRKLFAALPEAKAQGDGASFFSYNSGKGRCPSCQGLGRIKLQMNFLPEAETICESCMGRRYTNQADVYRYRGLSISDTLNLTFAEAKELFSAHRKIHNSLSQACELGLGYLTLGQSSATLSGGECQRLKIVSELSSPKRGHVLYLLDEPTTGLHYSDVSKLLRVFRSLIARGSTVMVIEHDVQVLRSADHLVEFGPGAGENGGTVIFEGTVVDMQRAQTPWGRVFRSPLSRESKFFDNGMPTLDARV